jgi:hypothetical protein
MQEYWYLGGSTGTLYLFLTYVEVDLLSWGSRRLSDTRENSIVSLLENNHRNKVFLDHTGVIIRTNTTGALLQHWVVYLSISKQQKLPSLHPASIILPSTLLYQQNQYHSLLAGTLQRLKDYVPFKYCK